MCVRIKAIYSTPMGPNVHHAGLLIFHNKLTPDLTPVGWVNLGGAETFRISDSSIAASSTDIVVKSSWDRASSNRRGVFSVAIWLESTANGFPLAHNRLNSRLIFLKHADCGDTDEGTEKCGYWRAKREINEWVYGAIDDPHPVADVHGPSAAWQDSGEDEPDEISQNNAWTNEYRLNRDLSLSSTQLTLTAQSIDLETIAYVYIGRLFIAERPK